MFNVILRFVKVFFPLFPELKSGNSNFHKGLSILGIIIFFLGLLGSAGLMLTNLEGEYLFSILVFLFLISILTILLNVCSFLYYILALKFFHKKISLKQNNYKNYFIFSLFVILFFMLLYFINKNTYVYVDRQQNFNNFYYDNSYISLTGDWDDDSSLAKEVTKHEIKCHKYSMECSWLTASIQEWNGNYFTVDSSLFVIDSWDTDKVHAVSETDTITEEITFYLNSCKMVYIKTPKIDAKEKSLLGFRPDDISLTMTDSYCFVNR